MHGSVLLRPHRDDASRGSCPFGADPPPRLPVPQRPGRHVAEPVCVGDRDRTPLGERAVLDRILAPGRHDKAFLWGGGGRTGRATAIPATASVIFIDENGEGPGVRLREVASDAS